MTKLIPAVRSHYLRIDGIRTHYLVSGEGPTVVLLHDGGYGGCGRVSWFANFEALAAHYRVIAPDWLGFGETDKLHDFNGGRARRIWHMTRFFEAMDIAAAAFIGSSMGASLLLQIAASGEADWPIRAIVSVSGGGFVPLNDARRRALEFDCTLASMRDVVATYVGDPKWLDDPRMIAPRFASATQPGAWEAIAAARFKSPLVPAVSSEFGNDDRIAYENIAVPTLIVAGAKDRLRDPGYAEPVARRIKGAELRVFPASGHLPHIEEAADFNACALDFLARSYPGHV
jgi:pimeloyl-ACP methyl ester carboxylesterase